MANLILYGGTFDPIHLGHVNTAIDVQQQFNFDRFLFLPCKVPVLKPKARASAEQRVAMIKLALADLPGHHFELDLSEINRDTPSYMVNTLTTFRQKLGEAYSITLLMGQDSFNQLPLWHDWEKLIQLANIMVINREGLSSNQLESSLSLSRLLIKHETKDAKAITTQPQGVIYCFDAGSFNFSSSMIRHHLALGMDTREYLNEAVLAYIKNEALYS